MAVYCVVKGEQMASAQRTEYDNAKTEHCGKEVNVPDAMVKDIFEATLTEVEAAGRHEEIKEFGEEMYRNQVFLYILKRGNRSRDPGMFCTVCA